MTSTPDLPVSFSRWLRRLRSQQGLTQEALAELAHCSVQTIRFFESGKRRPSLGMVEHLADLLQIASNERSEFIRLARLPLEAAEGAEDEPPVPVSTSVPPAMSSKVSLPALDHILIGREGERNILRQLLLHEQRRLVTLVGAGGMGKSHLALDVATALATHFSDGAAFVPLIGLRSSSHLPGAVAEVLHIPLGAGDPSEQVLAGLAPRQLLLVLDSFEQLLNRDQNAAVTWVNQLLQRAPRVQVLVTSRERLRLSGERIFELGGLSLPSSTIAVEASEAVLLFLERAQQAAGTFVLDAENKAAVMRICQLVDGMPLGIELAAAWVRVLTPAEIAEELAKNVDFLARANRDTPARHRSLRAIFDHSWELLEENERAVLMRMAVFRGGCRREAAEAVAGATLRVLASLIDKSLVRRTQQDVHARYDLHEVVRQFAAEKRRLVEGGAQHRDETLEGDGAWLAHYTYFYKVAVTAQQRLAGSEQIQWLRVLDEEHANLRAALDRCLTAQDHRRGLRLALHLAEYWYMRGHHREGLQRIHQFLAHLPTTPPTTEVANGLAAASILAIAGGNYAEARTAIELGVAAARALGDQWALTTILRYQGIVALHEEDYAAAELLFSEAATIGEALNNHYELATTLTHLAEIAMVQQQYSRAQALGERAVQLFRSTQDKNQMAGSLRRLAQAYRYQQQLTAARQAGLESLVLNHEIKDQRGTAASIVLLATLLECQTQWSAIAQMLGAADALLATTQSSLLPADQAEYDRIRGRCQQQLGDDFTTAHARGQAQIALNQEASYAMDWIRQLFT